MPTVYQAFDDWRNARLVFFNGLDCLISAAFDEYDMLDCEYGNPDNEPVVEAAFQTWKDLLELKERFWNERFGL